MAKCKDGSLYSGVYNRLFPPTLSANAFVAIYTLHLLDRKGKLYGKEILEEMLSETGLKDNPLWSPSHAILYPILRDMEEEGLIRGEWVRGNEEGDKRNRYYYEITEKGRRALRNALDKNYTMFKSSIEFLDRVIRRLYDIRQ